MAAKSTKKAESERKKADKLEHAHLRRSGINRIAALEEAREQRDREEAENLNSTATARTNLVSPKSIKGPVTPRHAAIEPYDPPQDVVGALPEDSESSTSSEEVDDEEPAARQPRKVRTCMLLRRSQVRSNKLQQTKTKAELKRERQARVRGEIDAARQDGGLSVGRPSKTAPTIAANIRHGSPGLP